MSHRSQGDHVAIYIGPKGRCVESGSLGVIKFNVHNGVWDTEFMARKRGLLLDTFYGVSYPLDGMELSKEKEHEMRITVANYCLTQVGKPYNLNF